MSDDTPTTRDPMDDATDEASGPDASGSSAEKGDDPQPDWVQRQLAGLRAEVSPDRDGGSGRGALLSGLLFSWLGFAAFQFFVWPALPLLSATTRRFAILYGVLALAVIVKPRLHALLLTLLLWGVVLVVISVDSALPVGWTFLDNPPSFTLYAAHLVLAAAQVPLISSAWGRLLPDR